MTVSLRALLRPLLQLLCIWAVAVSLAALANYVDLSRRSIEAAFAEIWYTWFWANIPFIALSYALLFYLRREHNKPPSLKQIVYAYLGVLLLFAPIDLAFQTWTTVHDQQQAMHWSNFVSALQQMRRIDWLVDFTLYTTTFAGVSAAHFWTQIGAREKSLQQAITDNLNLRVELEQQKLNALRAQLEPHFLFNALNAISALVRMSDKKGAITALNRLSDLLRYGLTASNKEWVTLADEIQFVRDYLCLQRLRYGDRLVVRIEGETEQVLAADCPPLLLQALVENALRHDLDCHTGVSDIVIRFQQCAERVQIEISNPVANAIAPNPGLGLGLTNTAARINLLFQGAATLSTRTAAGRFFVDIELPLSAPE